MKGWLASLGVGAFALLIGVGIGGLGPRAQVRALQAELADTRECSSNVGADIAKVFEGRAWGDKGKASKRKIVAPAELEAEITDAIDNGEPSIQIKTDDGEPVDVEESLEKAREVMDLRMAQARAALDQDASPTEEQWESIDSALDAMNADLQTLADGFAAQVQDGEPPGRRDAMEFAADTLDVLLKAEDELRGSLEPAQIDALQEESLDPTAYVDSSIIDALQALER